MSLSTGTIVDRYTIEGELGSGGMATVYRVRHVELGSVHAMKLLHITSPSVKRRLKREGQLQASLRHPNIVSVTDIVTWDAAPALVMEYVDGPTLEQFLTMHRPTHDQLDALADGLIRGVAAAHAMGMVHRDLKPANILLARGPQGPIPKIADFGLAKALDSTDGGGNLTRSGQAMGTPYYMAPEQAVDAKNVDGRVDVWALGAILYEMAAGRRAFEAEHLPSIFRRVMQADFDSLQTAAPDLPRRMVAAIEGTLKAEVDERLPDCQTLLQTWFEGVPSAQGTGPWDADVIAGLNSHAASRNSMSQIDGSGTFDPAALDNSPESLLPVDTAVPRTSRRSLLPFIGMAGAGMLLAVIASGVVVWQQTQAVGLESPQPPREVAEPDAPGADPPSAQSAQVEPARDVEPAPDVEPVRVVEPADTPSPEPAPGPPVAARPASTAQPAPPVRSTEAPAAPAPTEPEPVPAPASGTVTVSGEALAVQLVSAMGTYDPGEVPPDSYTVRASFPGSSSVVDAGSVTVSAGQTVRLFCDGGFLACHAQ